MVTLNAYPERSFPLKLGFIRLSICLAEYDAAYRSVNSNRRWLTWQPDLCCTRV